MREPCGIAHDVRVSRRSRRAIKSWKPCLAVIVAVIAAVPLLAAPASARTATFLDTTGDWWLYDDEPHPLDGSIDILEMTLDAGKARVRVTLEVADVLAVSDDHAQEFKAQLIWAKRADSWVTEPRLVVLRIADDPMFGRKCQGDRSIDGGGSVLVRGVRCSRDVENDTVSLSVPTRVFPRWAKYLRLATQAQLSVRETSPATGEQAMLRSAEDSGAADAWTKIG